MATFSDLPTELMIDIFKHVPAAQIQRSRRVCKKFRDTIDINSSSLSAYICADEVARLQGTIEYFMNDDWYRVVPESLRPWCELRGEGMYASRLVQLSCLENYVAPEKQSDSRSSSVDAELSRRRDLWSVCGMIRNKACRLLKTSAKRHESVMTIEEKDGGHVLGKKILCTCEDLSSFLGSVPDLDEDWARQLYDAIVPLGDSFRCGFAALGARRYFQKSVFVDLMPLLGLYSITGSICDTGPNRNPLENVAGIGARWSGVISMPELMRVFSVPFLPRRERDGRMTAYCVRRSWAKFEIQRSQSQQEVLDPLKKAALLEEMFIY